LGLFGEIMGIELPWEVAQKKYKKATFTSGFTF